jgi:tRNA nucleotidyltransferase (CCA-adding enzyme)
MVEFPIPSTVRKFATQFANSGYSLYIVGGAVRDHFIGRENTDYDFATDALPREVMALFPSVIPTGIKHGTVTVLFKGQHFEVTTFREDGEYLDMRRPKAVRFVRSLAEDLKRRDFTINAFAVDAFTAKLTDLHDGLGDLNRKLIRAIGEPRERFEEDALRILRACRFTSQLDFTIESDTAAAMKELSGNLSKVSGERIRDEFFKILSSPTPSVGILAMDACGALDEVLPELSRCKGVEQRGMHRFDVFYHSLATCDAAPRGTPLVRFAALLHDLGKVDTRADMENGQFSFHHHESVSERLAKGILIRFKCSNDDRDIVLNLVRNHMFHYTEDWSDGAVRRFINRVGMNAMQDLFNLRLADQIGISGMNDTRSLTGLSDRIEKVLKESSALTIRDLAIDGNELERIGIPKGPHMGVVLQDLLQTVLDDPSQNNRNQLATIALGFYKNRVDIQ